MEIGASVGPYVERIDTLPASFDFVEVAIGEGELPRDRLDPDRLAARLSARGFDAAVHLPYRQPLSTPVGRIDDATTAYLTDLLEVAADVGAETAVAHPSARGSGHESDQLGEQMRTLAARGRDHDVTVCFETVGYAGGISLDRVGALAVQADAAICLDVGYAYLEAGTDGVTEFLASYGDAVAHLHVHGARHRGDTHIPVGSGDVEYEAIGETLAETVSDGTATVEVFTDDATYLEQSAERFRAVIDGD